MANTAQKEAAEGLQQTFGKGLADAAHTTAEFEETTAKSLDDSAAAVRAVDDGITDQAKQTLDELNGKPEVTGPQDPPVEGAPPEEPAQGPSNVGSEAQDEAQAGEGIQARSGQGEDGNAGAETGGTDPVDLVSGQMLASATDVVADGVLPLILRRAYASGYRHGGLLGPGWSSTLDQRVVIDDAGVHFFGDDAQILSYPVPDRPGRAVLPFGGGARWPLTWDRKFDVITVIDPLSGESLSFPTAHEVDGDRQTRWLRRIEDRNGNWIQIERDEAGLPQAVLHQGGCRIEVLCHFDRYGSRIEGYRHVSEDGLERALMTFGYDASGRLTHVTDTSGVPYLYEHDEDDRINAWVDRVGYRYAYTYDDAGRVVEGSGDGGFLSATFAYDVEQRCTTVTDSLGHERVYRYDEHQHICEAIDELGNSVRVDYDRYRQARQVTDEVGATTSFTRDEHGDPIEVRRPDGTTIHTTYNEFRMPLRVTDPSGEAAVEYEYDERGNVLLFRNQAGGETRYERDERGLASRVTDPEGHQWQLAYDRAGMLTTATTADGQVTRYDYDEFGRLRTLTESSGLAWRYERDGEGRVIRQIGPGGAEWSAAHDPQGHLIEYRSEAGAVTRFMPGPFQRLSKRIDPDGSVFQFRYDTQLRLLAVDNPLGTAWSYRYDAAGNLVEQRDFDGHTTAYGHDPAGRTVSRTDPSGRVEEVTRDVLGRTVAETVDGEQAAYSYDADGLITSITGPDCVVELQRDVLGQVVAETVAGRTVRRDYDRIGRVLEQRLPSGHHTQSQFTPQGRLGSITGPRGGFSFRQDDANRETARYFGRGLALNQVYDESGLPGGQALWAGMGQGSDGAADYRQLYQRTYTYRPDGHTVSVNDSMTGTRTLTLDAPGRILASEWREGPESYTYDGLGAVSTGQQGRGSRTHYDLDERGQVTRILRTTISGRRREWHLTWDGRGRLTDAQCPDGSHWSYRYDPLGRRIGKSHRHADGSDGAEIEFTWYDTTLLEQRVVASPGEPAVITSWDYHPQTGAPIAQTTVVRSADGSPDSSDDEARTWQAVLTETNGTPLALVDIDGAITWQPAATVWGAPMYEDADPGGCPLRFPGQYHDPETGLHYNYARYYDPATGHYLSPDPLGLAPAPSPRAYVGNPWDQTDPLGLARHDFRQNGSFAVDPNKPPAPTHTRSTEYPHGYSDATHEAMVIKWTDQGRKLGAWPTDSKGNRIPKEKLTWRDANGKKLKIGTANKDTLTYDHQPKVVDHWNAAGKNTDKATRAAWFDDPDHLTPMLKGPNSSDGAKTDSTYSQDLGDDYSCS